MMKLRRSILALTLAGLIGFPSVASAASPIYQAPVLDPHSKSYFELRIDNSRGGKKPNWQTARTRAAGLIYKGRRGRLAIVKDQKALDFVRNSFNVREETWIGLRFFCKFRKLIWVNGDIHPLSQRELWSPKWHLSHIRCTTGTTRSYMPVFLTRADRGTVLWQASGSDKWFVSYLVEYPAPSPDKDKTAKNTEKNKPQ